MKFLMEILLNNAIIRVYEDNGIIVLGGFGWREKLEYEKEAST